MLEEVVTQYRRDRDVTTVIEVTLDPWRAVALGEREREGVTVSTFPQQDARVIPASQRLYDAVINQRITVTRPAEGASELG